MRERLICDIDTEKKRKFRAKVILEGKTVTEVINGFVDEYLRG